MSSKIKSKKLHRRQEEFIGDAYLMYRMKFILINKFPQTSMHILAKGCDVSNRRLAEFGRLIGIGGANKVEITIGNYCLIGDLESANKLIDSYAEFVIEKMNLANFFNRSIEPIVVYNISNLNKKQTKNFKFRELNYKY